MPALKTQQTRASVSTFLSSLKDKNIRTDCLELIAIMKRIAKEKPNHMMTLRRRSLPIAQALGKNRARTSGASLRGER